MRKRKSGQCQAEKTWGKQAPDTENAEGKRTSREAHKQSRKTMFCRVRKGQQPSSLKKTVTTKEDRALYYEASAGSFSKNLIRETNSQHETGCTKPIRYYKKLSKLYSGTQLHERTFERIAASLPNL
jgi:chromatin remodeling complex protein RSC6